MVASWSVFFTRHLILPFCAHGLRLIVFGLTMWIKFSHSVSQFWCSIPLFFLWLYVYEVWYQIPLIPWLIFQCPKLFSANFLVICSSPIYYFDILWLQHRLSIIGVLLVAILRYSTLIWSALCIRQGCTTSDDFWMLLNFSLIILSVLSFIHKLYLQVLKILKS